MYKPGDGCYASATTVALRLTLFDPAQDVFANIYQANLNTWGSSAGPGLLGHITRATDAAKRCARQNRAFPEPTGGGYTLTYEEMLRTSTMNITPTFRKMCKDLGGVEDYANPWRTLRDGFLDVHATTGMPLRPVPEAFPHVAPRCSQRGGALPPSNGAVHPSRCTNSCDTHPACRSLLTRPRTSTRRYRQRERARIRDRQGGLAAAWHGRVPGHDCQCRTRT